MNDALKFYAFVVIVLLVLGLGFVFANRKGDTFVINDFDDPLIGNGFTGFFEGDISANTSVLDNLNFSGFPGLRKEANNNSRTSTNAGKDYTFSLLIGLGIGFLLLNQK